MHVKCIRELCTILLVFQSYLHHIRVISLLYNDFWKYYIYFLFYGINPAQSKNASFFLLNFRDPNIVQITCKFMSINIRKEQDLRVKEPNKRNPEAQKRWAHAASIPGHVSPSSGASTLHCRRSFLHRLDFDLKTPIKIAPRRSLEGASPKHRNNKTEICSCRLEEENSGRVLTAWSPSSPSTSPVSP